ncbi:uncharacterized protein SPPG_08378 [Spizellomyces punctatus DAOM BR117]|uniref:LIM zinc-binding domain-containing protein n=1 Tax=Spizellomyces punctatus (strain DAOM BR117) TaxID=645134 RepID=A0A0L0H414_SPIPD|nr:uncharacterized protein SPPG_08378 [Spizellomyces punctatus DAOM BR117]KNC96225.1 hypothetical protein SPPG_08378 [Spizellomyces punctatus DAOM BR117]|eukprot:XP_016604265.1 hypothetical protein SPPG_08378 [Spizellomyces punctatus DAOM BR117]
MPQFGGAPSCPRCGKAVYLAEQVTGPNGMWHKSCLTCKECNKRLDSTSLTEREKEAYCKTCYGKLFGPKGYGFGGGAGVLNTDSTITDTQRFSPSPSPSNSRSGSQSNLMTSGSGSNPNLARTGSGTVTPGSGAGSAPLVGKPKFGGADVCPKCQKPVYFAEQMVGPMGVKYHKLCFRCTDCNKLVDSTTMADKEGVIYCKMCHGRKFGPKGYGYAGGAAGLTTD